MTAIPPANTSSSPACSFHLGKSFCPTSDLTKKVIAVAVAALTAVASFFALFAIGLLTSGIFLSLGLGAITYGLTSHLLDPNCTLFQNQIKKDVPTGAGRSEPVEIEIPLNSPDNWPEKLKNSFLRTCQMNVTEERCFIKFPRGWRKKETVNATHYEIMILNRHNIPRLLMRGEVKENEIILTEPILFNQFSDYTNFLKQEMQDFGTRYSPEEKIDLLKNMGVSGIKNVSGTDCFIIAAMQMIMRTPLMGFLRDPKNLISENQNSQLPSQLDGFFLQYAKKSENNLSKELSVNCFRDVDPRLRWGQQDAHEFFDSIFQNYNTSTIATTYTKSYVVKVNESESIPYEKSPSTAKLSSDDTYVVEMKKVEELFITLYMDHYQSKITPFQTLLNNFEEHDPELTGYKFNFSKKTYQTDPLKALHRFYDPKPFLLFMLPRYQSNGNKFSANVDFGDGEATLKGKKYALQAFVIHIGSNRHSGHYVAYGKDKEGQWQFFDDGQTKKVTHEQAMQAASDAYLVCLIENDEEELTPPLPPPLPHSPATQ